MRVSAFVLAAAGLFLAAAKAPEEEPVSYRITPSVEKDGSRVLAVDMSFRGDVDGETMLELPGEWAGSAELWRHATQLRIRGAKRISGYYDKPVLHHRPGAPIRVRYKVVGAYKQDPGFDYEKARPIVRPDWFFFHGEGVFAYPGGRQAAPARFRWGKAPRGWKIASDLDHIAKAESTVANVIDSVAIGGEKLQLVTRDIGGAPLRVALLGEWSFNVDALADTAAPILQAENEFWQERATPFLIAMAPLGTFPSGLHSTGTGRTDAFSIASTSAFEVERAVRLLAHEYMHSWFPGALGAMPQDEAVDYWFSEGFNDYLASKVLLGSGIWTLADWAADKNDTLLRYGTSSARTADAAEVAQRFWTDAAVQQVSYDRGHLLAAQVDAAIAARSNGALSLGDVVRAQREAAKGSSELASVLFGRTLLDKTGIDFAPELERHARRGEPLLLAADLYAGCARIETLRRRTFHRGYDAEATRKADGIITGVVRGGPAHAAGMRDGMKLIERAAGKIGDATVPIAYRVSDQGVEKLFTYLPEGDGEHEVQRMVVTATEPADELRCSARLGGAK